MPPLQFIGQSAQARSVTVDSTRLLNWYAEPVETRQGKAIAALYPTPGLTLFCTLPAPNGPVRSLYASSDQRVFAVQGAGFYELFADGRFRLLGTLKTTTGPAPIQDNGQALLVVDGPYGYGMGLSENILTQITDPAFSGADTVTFLDQYLVVNRPDSQQFSLSGLGQLTFDGLDFATAEGAPDRLVAVIANREELRLFGATSTETWFNSGALAFPLSRVPGTFLQIGCAAAQSVVRMNDLLYWLGADEHGQGIVWRMAGYQAERISTFPVETALQQYARLDDALGWGVQQDGHWIYWLTFPTAGQTWCYDASTGLWHERGTLDQATGLTGRHRANCACFGFGQTLVGDYASGNVYTLRGETDHGTPIVREATWPHVFDPQRLSRVQFRRFLLDAAADPASTQSPTQVALSWSDDGGVTFKPEHERSLGQQGQRPPRVQWWQMGASRDRVYRLRSNASVTLLQAYLDSEVLSA